MHPEHVFDTETGDDQRSFISIPAESLLDQDALRRIWPKSLMENENFLDQIETRKRLIDALRAIQSRINHPTASFETSLGEKRIQEEHVADLYEALADLLQHTPEYRRIILYVPFEYLLSRAYVPSTERLAAQAERLRNAYMQAWRTLLRVHDVRANFVDGDVLETEKRDEDLPRVVKAAHLIPFLVQKGWLSMDDVLLMRETSTDDVLRESIADTFGVLHDLELVDEDFMNTYSTPKTATAVPENLGNQVEPRVIEPDKLRQDIEDRLAQMNTEPGDSTKKRRAWLAEVHRQNVVEAMGDEVSLSVQHHLLTDAAVTELLLPEAHVPSQLALIDGLRKAIESAATHDREDAVSLYAQFDERLRALWEKKNPELQPALEKLFFRLHWLGIVDEATLGALELSVPNIDGRFSENVKHLGAEMDNVRRIVDSIRRNPDLMRHLYPVALMYGSRVKGYGASNADVDLGVFIKPTTPKHMRAAVRDMLGALFTSDSHTDPMTEFWLEENEHGLAVHDFDSHDRALGSSLYSHVLFGAAWNGSIDAIRKLYADLLAGYFRETDREMFGRNVRELYLEHLEQDLLQYRLMHKGYQRHYPSYGGLKSRRANRMDGSSMFWDSGYRAMATKLFAEKVFLPRVQQ